MDMAADENFGDKLKNTINNPQSEEAKAFKKVVAPMVKIVGGKIPWTPLERAGTVARLYAMNHLFNLSTFFITISPSMRNSPLALRMTLNKNCEKLELPTAHLRSKMIAECPIAAARVFYRIVEKVFDIIIGLPLDHYTGRRANVDRLLSTNKNKYIGPYGRVTAGLMSIEEQSGGSLHGHANLFGS